MFLKKVFNQPITKLLIVFFFLSLPLASNDDIPIKKALTYLKNLNEFSSSFLQIQNTDVSEGLIFIKDNRIRIEYLSPSNIIFVLKKNKGMYFNTELQEVQYFNPQKTLGNFLIDLFNNQDYFLDSVVTQKNSYFFLQKNVQLGDIMYDVKIYFEEKPFQLRKLEIINDLEAVTFTILNPNYNPNLNDNIFSLANPLLK